MEAIHLFSKMSAPVIGKHLGKKAHIVKLNNGTTQLWSDDSIALIGDNTMLINFKIKGPGSGFETIERGFNSESEASEYLRELISYNDISLKSDCEGRLSNGWTIFSDVPLRPLLKSKPTSFQPIQIRKKLAEQPQQKKITGKIIKLKDLTDNPRKARVILRSLVRKNQIAKSPRWEWSSEDKDLVVIRKHLEGKK